MAAIVTVTRDPRRSPNSGKNFERIVIDWTSAADGSATQLIENLYGWLIKAVTDPGATAPTDNYDITLVDENSIDAAESMLVNRDTANTETVYPVATGAVTPVFLCGSHTFTLANAGDSKQGRLVIYIAESI